MAWYDSLFSGGNTGSLIGAGLGLLAGGSSKGNETTQTAAQLDPRIARYIYGENGTGGLLGDAQSIYQQQSQQGGLNDIQREGLGRKVDYLRSPQFTQSNQTMFNQGMNLMNRGVAGNPFTQGLNAPQAPSMPSAGYQYNPSQAQAPIYRPAPQQAPAQAPTQQANPSTRETQGGNGGNISFGGSGGSSGLGQGNSEAMTKAALGLMAIGENPLLRTLFPGWAMAATALGEAGADQQIDARTGAFNAINQNAPNVNLGIGTISDADGNISTISTPGLIAAADKAMFGDTDTETGSRNTGSRNSGYGNMGNGGYGGATGGYGGSYGSGSVGGW